MQTMDTELEQLIGKVIGDLGGTANAALVIVGDRLGLYRTLARSAPRPRTNWPGIPARTSDTSASGSPPRRLRVTSTTTRSPLGSACPASRPCSSPMRTARSTWPGASSPRRRQSPTNDTWRRRSVRGAGSRGAITTNACSAARRSSSAPPMPATSSSRGSRRWGACTRGSRPGESWPTSAAGAVARPSSWRRRTRPPRSSGSIATRPRSSVPARWRPAENPECTLRGRDGARLHADGWRRLRPGRDLRRPA